MNAVTKDSVISALDKVMDPELHHSVVKLGFILDVEPHRTAHVPTKSLAISAKPSWESRA